MKHACAKSSEFGTSIIMALGTLAFLIGFVSLAVDYSSNVGSNAQRDRVFNTAVEIGDGCLELAFGSWRKLSGVSEAPSTSAFTAIPTPNPGMFPSYPDAAISNFRIQAVDPVMTLSSQDPPISALPTSSAPPKTTGAGSGTFSYFYLATVDVSLPYKRGNLTAKVRRVFEKRYTSAWNWAMLYNGDLELHPNSPLTLDGWVHANGNAYIGNGVMPPPAATPGPDGIVPATPTPTPPPSMITFADRLTYAGNFIKGYHGGDERATTHTNVADAISPADLPPGSEQVYYPFGWNPALFNATDTKLNNDGFREMIERPVISSTDPDPVAKDRLYNQASLVFETDDSNVIKVFWKTGATKTPVTSTSGNDLGALAYSAAGNSFKPGYTFQDNREGVDPVRVVNFDVAEFVKSFPNHNTKNWNGIIYVSDTSGSATNKRGIRIVNGSKVPKGGMTIVSDNPVYVQGDFNSGRVAGSAEPASNLGNPEDPDASGYTRQPASIMADAITLLSNSWNDGNSSKGLNERIASNTTVNAALVAGNVPTKDGVYSGGGENFVRFLEDWTGKTFTYYGAMMNMYASKQAIGAWSDSPYSNVYAAPNLKWFFDKTLSVDSQGNPVSVPGYVSTVAYLQQQRWYLQF